MSGLGFSDGPSKLDESRAHAAGISEDYFRKGNTLPSIAEMERAIRELALNTPKGKPTALPTDKQERKDTPICSGVLDYFPAAIAEVARVSKAGNDQHNPGQPMHWARGKSNDHADCVIRHTMERGSRDIDGVRHSAKAAWRALALLQEELEAEGAAPGRASRFPEKKEWERT